MSRNRLGMFSDCTFAGALVDAMDVAARADRHGRESLPETPLPPPVEAERRWTWPAWLTPQPVAFARGLGAAAVVLGTGLVVTWLA